MSMNARDYTHKRFRSGSSGTASSPVKASPIGQSPNRGGVKSYYKIGPLPGEMMDSSSSSFDSSGPPRLVTPTHNHHSNNTSNNSNNHKATLSPTPKHRDSNSPGSPLVHTPTATSGGLTQVSRDVSSIDANKNSNNSSSNKYFSLDAVKPSDLSADHPAHSPFRGDDYDNPPTSAKSNKLKDAHSQAIQNHNLSDSLSKSTAGSATTGSKIVQQDPNAYKIFLLLLQPKSKIFELIQIIYSPFDTTIGHILQMIPDNATEPALGTQHYIGLCRPKQQQELLDTELLASEPRPGADVPTARISLGEILVAIPNGYTGQDVAYLSKQILANPKIVKLLKRADPLARRNKHRSSRRHGNRSSRAVERVHVLEKHDETEEEFLHNYNSSHHHHHNNASSPPRASKTTSPIFRENNNEQEDVERLMQLALDNAAAEAAAANAAIPGGRPSLANYSSTRNLKTNSTFDRDLPGVRRTQSNDESIDPHHHHHNNNNNNHHQHHVSEQLSIDDSYSSWSKSFDASFSGQPGGSICSGASKRVARRRERHARRVRILQRSALIGVVAMIAFYVLDPKNSQQQQQRQAEQLPYSIDVQAQTPMGIMGIFQCLFLLLTLYKAERLSRSAREAEQRGTLNNSNAGPDAFYMSEERRCPFLKASAKALKRFKHKYSKRLKREQQQQSNANAVAATSVITTATTTGGSGEEGNYPYNYNGSTKLRSFPLKASSGGIPTTTTTSKLFGSSS